MSPDVLLSACLYIDKAKIRYFKFINKFIFICFITLDSVYLHKQSIINVLIEYKKIWLITKKLVYLYKINK